MLLMLSAAELKANLLPDPVDLEDFTDFSDAASIILALPLSIIKSMLLELVEFLCV